MIVFDDTPEPRSMMGSSLAGLDEFFPEGYFTKTTQEGLPSRIAWKQRYFQRPDVRRKWQMANRKRAAAKAAAK